MNKLNFAIILIFLIAFQSFSQDRFADIGTRKYETRENLLVVPQPPVLPDIFLPVTNNKASIFNAEKQISTKEELYKELAILRKQYEPFMQNLAPALKQTRSVIPLTEFNWRIETPEDITNFVTTLTGNGKWEKVSIPHFGPPVGRAVTYYFKNIDLETEVFAKGNLFICFKGVDYKTSVFMNGAYCGSHEGFFAPFEFDVTRIAHPGRNTILVKVENDFTTTGGTDKNGNKVIGDKIYAATGPGFDDPEQGWHHCPAGMGIYQDCYLESRSPLQIRDIFVRPILNDSTAEAWIEINNYKEFPTDVLVNISVYGQNFPATVIEDLQYIPTTTIVPGVGDLAKPTDWKHEQLKMGYGVNYLRIPVKIKDFRLWNNETPWLYQMQVKLYDHEGKLTDTKSQQFGMRSFSMDTVNIPKGNMYLNGNLIRLRGANTMGHLQQCVIRKNWDQLRDDILLAKLCNMNYLRLTQRPVQPEIYDYCDRLGLMNQADLPLFGSIRRNKFAEAVKQAEEMERLVRIHPSTIMVSYINERFPNAEGNPQRSLNTAEEYYHLFKALDQAILLSNPDRVIKSGDGDYDPPSPGLPDSHCYNTWYNGHGLGIGEMYRGYWQPVKPGWYYACGEFGAEGLDPLNVMEKYYPREWLPTNKEDEKNWDPGRIKMAQTKRFHYMWYNTPHSLNNWIEASQDYQAWAVKFVTESFRRDQRMVSFAVHLFIDAWPAGWMKSIMDVDRQPKKAYFAYRRALEPLMISIRSDRNQFFEGEETAFEAWICNDYNTAPSGYRINYQLEKNGKPVFANQVKAEIPINSSKFQGFIKFKCPEVSQRTEYTLRIALFNNEAQCIYQNKFDFEVFPEMEAIHKKVFVLGKKEGIATTLVNQSGCQLSPDIENADVILIDDFDRYKTNEDVINKMVEKGKTVLFTGLSASEYKISNTTVSIDKTNMGNYYFVSPETGHQLVKSFKPFDFRFLYNGQSKMISPILGYTIKSKAWTPILSSGASNWTDDKGPVMAAAELKYGEGVFRICELDLADKLQYNPTALMFFEKLLGSQK